MKIRGLTLILIITISISFWINFVDFKIATFWLFKTKANKLESIIDNLCLSYIAGYIFYFINVYLVEKAEKKHILPYVAFKVSCILVNNYHIIQVLKQDAKLKGFYPDRNEFSKLLSTENLSKIIIYNYEKKTFINYLNLRGKSTLNNIEKVLTSSKYVDDELRSILLKLNESMLLNEEYCLNTSTFNTSTFNRYNGVFNTYFSDIEVLYKYYDKNLKLYFHLNFKGLHKRKYKIVQ